MSKSLKYCIRCPKGKCALRNQSEAKRLSALFSIRLPSGIVNIFFTAYSQRSYVMAQVSLLKKNGSYVNKDGEEKKVTNFFVRCGDVLVPIEVKYFESKETGKDDRYRERRVLLSAFAEELPDKGKNGKTEKKPALEPMDDDSYLPFN